MIIKKAKEVDSEVLSLLGLITYKESHGHFIENKEDLKKYNETAFSISKTKVDLNNPNIVFYIIYVNDLPAGYAKLVLNGLDKSVNSQNNCQLERIYILDDFIPLRIGQKFLTFLEEEAKAMHSYTIWLSVYIKNERAIRFYQKNGYENVGKSIFLVHGTEYENIVFSKNI